MTRALILALMLMSFLGTAAQPEALVWDKKKELISADIKDWPLGKFLEKLAEETNWEIYVQPNTELEVSAKFKNNPSGEGLSKLLGKLSYAVLPPTNGNPRLLVFRTGMQEATQLIKPKKEKRSRHIANELIVTLKEGEDIEEFAKKYGAKIVGRLDEINTYRLRFDSAADAAKARDLFASDPAVESIDLNYSIDRPISTDSFPLSGAPGFSLRPSDGPGSDGKVVVALVDTFVQKTGASTDAFLLDSLSVAGPAGEAFGPTHGTSMMNTMLQALQGVAGDGQQSNVRILPIDIYGASESTTTFNVAHGIYTALGYDPKVINLSLGSDGESAVLYRAIQQASQRGVIIVAAGGNQPVFAPNFPAGYPETMAVTSLDRRGNIASWANRAPQNDLAAPSTFLYRFGNQTYFVSGTSASTAHVAGIAAGLLDAGKTAQQAEAALRNTYPVPAK